MTFRYFLQQTFESEEIIRDGSGAFCWSGYGRFVEVIGSNSSSPWVLTQPKVYKKHDIGLSPQKDFHEVSDDTSVIFLTLYKKYMILATFFCDSIMFVQNCKSQRQ